MLQRVWSKGDPLTLLVGIFTGVWNVDNCMEIPQKSKNWTTIWSGNHTPGHLSRENHDSKRHPYSSVHCSTLYHSQDRETTQCPTPEERIKNMWSIYTMEYYSVIKREEGTVFAATWMDLDMIMLSEITQTVRHPHQMLSLTWGIS